MLNVRLAPQDNANPRALTNDLLYESNDSREIEKASISDSLSRVPVEAPEGFDLRGQKLFFSGGEGLVTSARTQISPNC